MIKKLSYFAALLVTALLISACGDGIVDPDDLKDDIHDIAIESQKNINEYNKDYYSSSSSRRSSSSSSYRDSNSSNNRYSSSSWYDDWYSSSSESTSIYTYKPSTITLTLTYYHQLKSMDEKNTTDGDPRIFFGVKSYSDGVLQDSIKTSTINLGDNVGTWSGSKSVTAKLSGGIDEILVCPVFTDADALFDDHEYSSDYCYYVHNLGQKIGQTIQQDDYMATYFEMEWKVKVNYN